MHGLLLQAQETANTGGGGMMVVTNTMIRSTITIITDKNI